MLKAEDVKVGMRVNTKDLWDIVWGSFYKLAGKTPNL